MSLLNLLEEFVMFEKIRKMKNKKGFTLVELIVVLVILAILAALLIPALTGYIDKANEEKVTAECRMVVMGAQTVGTTFYADHSTLTRLRIMQKSLLWVQLLPTRRTRLTPWMRRNILHALLSRMMLLVK